jgi:hypothetical protein
LQAQQENGIMNGYSGSGGYGGPDDSEIHDLVHVVSDQPHIAAVEQNVPSEESEFGSISTEMHRNTVVNVLQYFNSSA